MIRGRQGDFRSSPRLQASWLMGFALKTRVYGNLEAHGGYE